LMYAVRYSSLAHPSLTKWYAMALVFFLSVDVGAVVLAKTDWFSPKIKVGSSTVITIIRNLKGSRSLTYSVACFIATNLPPNVLVLQEPCILELHYIGELFKTMNSAQERWVTKSPV
jgi:hypothetical protein